MPPRSRNPAHQGSGRKVGRRPTFGCVAEVTKVRLFHAAPLLEEPSMCRLGGEGGCLEADPTPGFACAISPERVSDWNPLAFSL